MDERMKKQVMLAIVGFNVCVIGYQFCFNNTLEFNLMTWLIALGVGVIGGGIGFALGRFIG